MIVIVMHQYRRCSARKSHTLDYQRRRTCTPHVFAVVGMSVRHSVGKTEEKASAGPSPGRATVQYVPNLLVDAFLSVHNNSCFEQRVFEASFTGTHRQGGTEPERLNVDNVKWTLWV